MKKFVSLAVCALLVCALCIVTAGAQTSTIKVTTPDKLVTIELPDYTWYQLITDEHTEMFSDGDCAILIDMYEVGDALPAIVTADENHEFVYTAAVSTSEYIMIVTGYAHEKADFSPMVKAINTIQLSIDDITEEAVEHNVPTSEYTIRDTWFTAWVNAERLNVRAGSGTENAILTSLSRGTRLTVTGTVLKNGVDIGWSAVTLENGTKGYVSTQFLTTTEPRPAGSTQTGNTVTLYDSYGTPVILYQYADGSWKNAGGVKYWVTTSGSYTNEFGDVLYTQNPTAAAYRTGYSITLYRADGTAIYVYEYSNGTWMDEHFQTYTRYNAGQWQCASGEILDLEPQGPTPIGQFKTMYRADGTAINLYAYSDGTWRRDTTAVAGEVTYTSWTDSMMEGSDGSILYTYDPAGPAPSAY